MQKLLRALSLAPVFLILAIPVQAQQIDLSNQIWSAEVIRSHGQPVIPLFDGWYGNDDGSKTICFGYFNMNSETAVDVAAGADNYLETDYPGLDLSTALIPTHFDPLPPRYRHVFCAFTVTVPEDFSARHRITWHLSSNGQALSVPGKVIAPYVMDEPASDGRGDVAPAVWFEEPDRQVRGRTGLKHPRTFEVGVNEPLSLSAWVDHHDPEVWVGWSHHSGPGKVMFTEKEYMTTSGAMTSTEASFDTPGNYVVRMQTIDDIAAFEFYCCHTNAYYRVRVTD